MVMGVPSGEEKWSARLKTTFGGAAQSSAVGRLTRYHNRPSLRKESMFTNVSLEYGKNRISRLYLTGIVKDCAIRSMRESTWNEGVTV